MDSRPPVDTLLFKSTLILFYSPTLSSSPHSRGGEVWGSGEEKGRADGVRNEKEKKEEGRKGGREEKRRSVTT